LLWADVHAIKAVGVHGYNLPIRWIIAIPSKMF
jgi:hypothetical protein